MNKEYFAFNKINFLLIFIGLILIIAGFILMGGDPSTEEAYNPDIFSTRRIKVAPVVCFAGFVFMIFAIIYKPKKRKH